MFELIELFKNIILSAYISERTINLLLISVYISYIYKIFVLSYKLNFIKSLLIKYELLTVS